jgi:1,2-diacylglycerol 3-alpha-glucosyltransferase
MRSQINIVLLTPGFAADASDTAAIPSLQLYAKSISSHYPELNIKVITFHYPFYRGTYLWNGIRVYSFAGRGRKWNKPFLWINILILLFRLRRSDGVSVVHAFWLTETTFIGWLYCRLTGTPFLATAMGQDATQKNHYLRILRFFSFPLTMISEYQSRFLKPFGKSSVFKVIPFGIDPSCCKQEKTERSVDIIGVGSMNKVKNYDLFIKVIELLVRHFPGIKCIIIGDGNERSHIEKSIGEKGLETTIHLKGSLRYETVMKEMHSGKILLHTSAFEGQGLVITEALAAGLYVVSTPVGMAYSLSSKKLMTGTGSEELAAHITGILQLQSPDFEPEFHYSIGDTCRVYSAIYKDLASGKGK